MSERKRKPKRTEAVTEPFIHRALRWVICWSVLGISLVVSVNGRDPFRLPKELFFRAEVIAIAVLLLVGLILGQIPFRKPNWKDPVILFPSLILGWTAVATLMSTNRALSVPSLWYVAGTCLVFVTTVHVARGQELKMLNWALWGGFLNGGMFLLQRLEIWNPFSFVAAHRVGSEAASLAKESTGFVGNANDLGSALLPVFVAAVAASIATRKQRPFRLIAALTIAAALLAGVAFAAIGAMVVALVSMLSLWNWKRGLQVIAVLTLVSVAIVPLHRDLRERVRNLTAAVEAGRWGDALRGRLMPFSAALLMVRDHPLTGIGPGAFGWQYYPYKIELVTRDPSLFRTPDAEGNFEETHNDHLEVLSETGVPGFLILLAALGYLVVAGSKKLEDPPGSDERPEFARLTMLPLAVSFAALAMAQYPLQLTSATANLVMIIGLCCAWRPGRPADEEVDEPRAKLPTLPARALVALVLIVAIGTAYQWCLRPMGCNVLSKQTEAALFAARKGNDTARMLLNQMLPATDACRSCLPRDTSLNIVVASTYNQLGKHEEERKVYDEALQFDQRPEFYFNRAVARLRSGDREGAIEDYVLAARFRPAVTRSIADPNMRVWVMEKVRESQQ